MFQCLFLTLVFFSIVGVSEHSKLAPYQVFMMMMMMMKPICTPSSWNIWKLLHYTMRITM